MPATPRFRVSQTDINVVVVIKVPHIRVGGAETHVDGTEFSFYCKPYLLRLTLPHEVGGEDDDGSCKAVYDPADENGTITVTLKKAVPGLHFPDLDLTTTLMQPRWTPKDLLKERPNDAAGGGSNDGAPASSGVEVLSSEHYDVRDDDNNNPHESPAMAAAAAAAAGEGPESGVSGDGSEERERVAAGISEDPAAGGPGGTGPEILMRPPSYGFNDKFSGFFVSLRDELREMIHLPDPDDTPPSARRGLRLEHEEAAFDADRYLGDLFPEDEDPILAEALAFDPHWQRTLRGQRRRRRQRLRRQQRQPEEKLQTRDDGEARAAAEEGDVGESDSGAAVEPAGDDGKEDCAAPKTAEAEEEEEGEEEEGFTEAEEEQMRRLPNREYLIEPGGPEERRVLLGLADILFAYAYDHRTTTGDPSVESAWTVAVLSPLLSWLEAAPADEVDDQAPRAADACASVETRVALGGIRRSLIFPYLRVWELAALVTRDVRDILTAGKRCILRCLLRTYAIMERGEVHYLLNKLFIEDYCVWIQKASEESLAALAERYAVAATSITKNAACLDLEKIEAGALGFIAASGSAERCEEQEEEEEKEGGEGEDNSEEDSCEEDSSEEDSSEEDSSEGDSSEEDSSEEDSSEEDSSEEDSSEEESTEKEGGSSGEQGCGVETVAAGPEKARKGAASIAPPVAAAPARKADSFAPAPVADEGVHDAESGTPCDPESLPGSGQVASSQGVGEGLGKVPVLDVSTSSGEDGQSTTSRGVARSTDLLRLEALAGGAGAAGTGKEVSSALVSRLAVLSLGEQRALLGAERRVAALRDAEGVNGPPPPPPPPPVSSKEEVDDRDAGGVVGGTDSSLRKPLIEEL